MTEAPSIKKKKALYSAIENKSYLKSSIEFPFHRAGSFTLGCNYWASHAGTHMWSDWKPEVVEADFAALAASGVHTLRVFPLWSDFQPLQGLRGHGGELKELYLDGQPLPDDRLGRAGVSPVMLDRFAALCAVADRHDIRLVVGLVTGWMSGRVFCPPVLEGRDLHSDPLALQLQSRFVSIFVERFRGERAILAWDLGNECNCMGNPLSREAAWVWTSIIASAVRLADPTRPLISGMHSLTPVGKDSEGWTIQDQAELTDILTTHPYPLWTRHASFDPLDTLRTTCHATAETRFYAGIGGKPCFVEEIGTMGPMMGDWEAASRFLRVNCFSLWANDCRGLFWWCAFDQRHLNYAPYDWLAVERELGLFSEKRQAKPMRDELSAFRRVVEKLPGGILPPPQLDVVCILTRGQDQWAAAYASWVLAVQAKLTLRFVFCDDPLPESRFYWMPSISGVEPILRRRWRELLQCVHAGAELLVTLNDGVLEPFTEIFGVRVLAREHRVAELPFTFEGETLTARSTLNLRLAANSGTEVLAAVSDDNALLTRCSYGAGRVMLGSIPIETQLALTPGAFHGKQAEPWHRIYRSFTSRIERLADCADSNVAVTVHGERYAVFVNHGANSAEPIFAPRVRLRRWIHGGPLIAPHDGTIAEIEIER